MRISVSACIKISTVAQHNTPHNKVQHKHNENTEPGFKEDQNDPEQSFDTFS